MRQNKHRDAGSGGRNVPVIEVENLSKVFRISEKRRRQVDDDQDAHRRAAAQWRTGAGARARPLPAAGGQRPGDRRGLGRRGAGCRLRVADLTGLPPAGSRRPKREGWGEREVTMESRMRGNSPVRFGKRRGCLPLRGAAHAYFTAPTCKASRRAPGRTGRRARLPFCAPDPGGAGAGPHPGDHAGRRCTHHPPDGSRRGDAAECQPGAAGQLRQCAELVAHGPERDHRRRPEPGATGAGEPAGAGRHLELYLGGLGGPAGWEMFYSSAPHTAQPWRLYVIDPFALFSKPLRSQLLAKSMRMAEPRGGRSTTISTAVWSGDALEHTNGYAGLSPDRFWATHLAVVYNVYDPTLISVSLADFEGRPRQFAVKGNAPDPAQVSVAPGPVRYELLYYDYDDAFSGAKWDYVGPLRCGGCRSARCAARC